MINWHILSASANNGCMRVCVRPRMKKGIYIVIMKIIRINGASRVIACRLAWVCACAVVTLNGMVCTDTPGSRSRMALCMRVRMLVWNRRYVPVLSRPEMRIKLSPSWSRQTRLAPFQRLSLPWPAQNKLEGIVETFENCPHGLRNWKREGLGACARLGYALTQRRLHLPAQMR